MEPWIPHLVEERMRERRAEADGATSTAPPRPAPVAEGPVMTDGTYHVQPTSWPWASPTLRRSTGVSRRNRRRRI